MRPLNIVVENWVKNSFFENPWLNFWFGGQKHTKKPYIQYIFSSFSADRMLWRVTRHWKRIDMRDKEEKWPTVRFPDVFIQQSPHGSQHCLCLSVNTWQPSGRLCVSKITPPTQQVRQAQILTSWNGQIYVAHYNRIDLLCRKKQYCCLCTSNQGSGKNFNITLQL